MPAECINEFNSFMKGQVDEFWKGMGDANIDIKVPPNRAQRWECMGKSPNILKAIMHGEPQERNTYQRFQAMAFADQQAILHALEIFFLPG